MPEETRVEDPPIPEARRRRLCRPPEQEPSPDGGDQRSRRRGSDGGSRADGSERRPSAAGRSGRCERSASHQLATEEAGPEPRDEVAYAPVVAERTRGERTRLHSFGWARVAPWRGQREVAHLVLAEGSPPPRSEVDECLVRLRRAGYQAIVTSALTAADSLPFVDAGFGVRERLHLLEHDCRDVPAPSRREPPLRRAWRTDRAAVLALDALAFDDFWQLEPDGLSDALHATPAVRFRVGDADDGCTPAAYAITGRAGRRGYLQRVAVDPRTRRRGWGRTLVLDALRWLGRHDTRRALVNTQWENQAALALYESCGFRRLPVGLSVLDREL